MIDYHVHSNFSFDCDESMEESILSAIEKNVEEIAFCDHYDINYPHNQDFTFNVDNYFSEITRLQKKYDKKITIKKGIELGLNLDYKKEIDELLNKYEFDFIIGSIHVINNTDFFYGDFFVDKTIKEANFEYFEYVYECLRTFNKINVLGHLDFIIRYGENNKNPLDYLEYKIVIDKILNELINSNRGIEINTSGLRQGCNQTFPSKTIYNRYLELGGKIITLGSDSHTKDSISSDFKNVLNDLKLYKLTPSIFDKTVLVEK